jgi:hypothetical protein
MVCFTPDIDRHADMMKPTFRAKSCQVTEATIAFERSIISS